MKKLLAVLMVICLSCGICACGSEDKIKPAQEPEAVTENTDTAEEPAEQEEVAEPEEFEEPEEAAAPETSEKPIQPATPAWNGEYNIFGDYEDVPVWNSDASSQLDIEEDYYKYHPENLYDYDLTTAYVEGEDDNGIGQMVKFSFGEGFETMTYVITRIMVYPGYQKSKETFENNSRPTKLTFYFPDGNIRTADLGDDYSYNQPFALDIDPVIADSCIMVIEDAVSGKKYNDCCLSEVHFCSQQTDGMLFYTQMTDSANDDGTVSSNYDVIGRLNGEAVWTYKSRNPLTELADSPYVTSGFGKVIIYDDQKIKALDVATGELLWVNEDTGFPSACSFDRDGNLYVCGYYGSNVCVIDKDGNTLRNETGMADEDYTWATMLTVRDDDKISIYYSGYVENDVYGKIFTTDFKLN